MLDADLGATVATVGQYQHIARVDPMRIPDLRIDVPDLGPLPGILQEYVGNAPQGVTAFDGVFGGRGRFDHVCRRRGRRGHGGIPRPLARPNGGLSGGQLHLGRSGSGLHGRDGRFLDGRGMAEHCAAAERHHGGNDSYGQARSESAIESHRPLLNHWGWGSSTAVIIGPGGRHTTYCQVCALDHAPTRGSLQSPHTRA